MSLSATIVFANFGAMIHVNILIQWLHIAVSGSRLIIVNLDVHTSLSTVVLNSRDW